MNKVNSKHNPTKPQTKTTIGALGILVSVLLVLLAACSQKQNDTATADLPKEISVSEAYDKREAGAFILDVREPDEWKEYHIPDSTLIPLGQLQSRVYELPRDQEIVVICRSGNRSQAGRDLLTQAGFTQVTSMAGGIKEWSAAGYPTVSGD